MKNYVETTDNYPRIKTTVGLGDAVAFIAQPVAIVIDKVAGTKLKNCGSCKDRRKDFNNKIPDILHPFK